MFSAFIRRIVFCLLLAAIPVQGMAAAAMLYCCDREGNADTSQVQDDSVHQVHEAAATDQADLSQVQGAFGVASFRHEGTRGGRPAVGEREYLKGPGL